ncbi:MAG: hypothetical protein HYY20_04490 [Candidatus Tectomicrobia bacterium]|uniref:Uroporphyrinogen decarboxylase (URO-D) domain-containing protein n=1 Tax=Tectimicrobiota bacterium TaxID=2528274 RepID=A0A932FY54_UNCTE|nr:hypothetical protein [Candidatus Tectomicrobia bacterium]
MAQSDLPPTHWQDGFARFMAAARGTPDRVPVSAQMPEHAMYLAGLSSRDFYTRPEVFVEAMLAAHGRYGLDVVYLFYDVYNVEAEALGAPLLYPERGVPYPDPAKLRIQEKGDLDRLAPPIPGQSGRMPFVLEVCRQFTDRTGTPALIGICAPFSLAAAVRGYVPLVRDLRRDPSFAHRLLGFLTGEVLIPWAREVKRATGGKVVLFAADAWASPPNIDQRIQEEFVVPYVKQLKQATGVSSQGQWGQSHLPDPERFLETQREMGMPVTGLDPDAERLGPERFKRFATRHGAPLTLGLSPLLLRDGPVEQIVERVRHYVQVGAPGGRFFLFLANVPADTPPAHIQAAVDAVERFGRYSS